MFTMHMTSTVLTTSQILSHLQFPKTLRVKIKQGIIPYEGGRKGIQGPSTASPGPGAKRLPCASSLDSLPLDFHILSSHV